MVPRPRLCTPGPRMTRTVIIAPMAGELKPLVRSWQHEKRNGIHLWRWSYPDGEWIAACGGAGVNAATRAFAEAEKEGTVSSVISVGWVGALDRSEEHTSELQSLRHLVCRLLLEKK